MAMRRRARREASRVTFDLGKSQAEGKSLVQPGGRLRPNVEAYSDPNYRWETHDPKLADDVMEQIAAAKDGYASPTFEPDASERERVKREERQFLAALPRALNEHLVSHGLLVTGATENGNRDGYIVRARDRAGRPFEASLSLDEGIGLGHERGETMGRGIIGLLVEKLLAARQRYFDRMAS